MKKRVHIITLLIGILVAALAIFSYVKFSPSVETSIQSSEHLNIEKHRGAISLDELAHAVKRSIRY